MKKLLFFFIVSILAISVVFATDYPQRIYNITTGNMDSECIQAGYDFGIVKWDWNETTESYQNESVRLGYTVSISGDDTLAYWTSSPAAAGRDHRGYRGELVGSARRDG